MTQIILMTVAALVTIFLPVTFALLYIRELDKREKKN